MSGGRERSRRLARVAWIGLAAGSAAVWLAVAAAGDLGGRPATWLGAHAALLALALGAFAIARRAAVGVGPIVLTAALFRLIAVAAPASLSDDVQRYVWDGRVQLHGIHPYRHAPSDPALAELRDADWARINHPEVRTIYPPLAQASFALLASTGAGPRGFKLGMALADFAVVLALARLLRLLELPHERLILYAWNPLAVFETAASGHVEPLAIALVVVAAGWIIEGRGWRSTFALGAAVQVKLLPLVAAPGWMRRAGFPAGLGVVAAIVVCALPYALTGPGTAPGFGDYVERWERGALVYAGAQSLVARIDVARHVETLLTASGASDLAVRLARKVAWPRALARVAMVAAFAGVALWVVFGLRTDVVRETLVLFGAALVLSPTIHPWYALWVLPFAAALRAWGWLALAALLPLGYLAGENDLSAPLRGAIWGPAALLLVRDAVAGWRARMHA